MAPGVVCSSTAEFVLRKGVDVAAMPRGETGPALGVVWRARARRQNAVAMESALDVIGKRFDGTPLGSALYGWFDKGPRADHDGYYEVVARLVRAGASVKEWRAERQMPKKIRGERKMRASLRGELPR